MVMANYSRNLIPLNDHCSEIKNKYNCIDQKIESIVAMFWTFFQNKNFLKMFHPYNTSKI
jgi:hypothetical protein